MSAEPSKVDQVDTATRVVERLLGGMTPRAAVVLGSGFGAIAGEVDGARRLAYHDVPGFPAATVAGHRGELVVGTLAGVSVVVQDGRFHLYEGYVPETVVLPVRVFARLGVHAVVLTNASGGIRRAWSAGTVMLIADHLNLMWRHPLVGGVVPGEERFPDMSAPYDPALRQAARAAARESGLPLEEGVYAGVLGPSYETAAEIRMLDRLGADVVGMSTVPEVIAARAAGLRCAAFSVIANLAAGLAGGPLEHTGVLDAGRRATPVLGTLLRGVLRAV